MGTGGNCQYASGSGMFRCKALCTIIKIMLRKAKTMDEELKKEFKKIHKGLKKLNTKIDKLEEKGKRNTLDANKTVLAVVGLSLVVAGVTLQLQQHDWSSSGSFIFLGAFIAVLASLWGTSRFMTFIKISLWVTLSIAVGLTVYVVVVILSA